MVCFYTSISVCNSVDQPPTTIMANSVNTNDLNSKSRNRKVSTSPTSSCLKIPACGQSRYAAVDVIILIAVVVACGFLLVPCIMYMCTQSIEFIGVAFDVFKEEIGESPLVYGSIGVGFFSAAAAASIVLICTSRKCGNPNCKGLRKAAEFDIQLETEDCVKNSTTSVKDGAKRGLFELPRDHHKELETELKKMAPVNGRAVLVFRARCGCSVGRLEVPGPKKQRKIKIKNKI